MYAIRCSSDSKRHQNGNMLISLPCICRMCYTSSSPQSLLSVLPTQLPVQPTRESLLVCCWGLHHRGWPEFLLWKEKLFVIVHRNEFLKAQTHLQNDNTTFWMFCEIKHYSDLTHLIRLAKRESLFQQNQSGYQHTSRPGRIKPWKIKLL